MPASRLLCLLSILIMSNVVRSGGFSIKSSLSTKVKHKCEHTYTRAHAHAHRRVCAHRHVCARTQTRVRTPAHRRTHTLTHSHTRAHILIHMFTRAHMQTQYAFRLPIPGGSNAPSVHTTPDPHGYEPMHLWLLARHGTRWPTKVCLYYCVRECVCVCLCMCLCV